MKNYRTLDKKLDCMYFYVDLTPVSGCKGSMGLATESSLLTWDTHQAVLRQLNYDYRVDDNDDDIYCCSMTNQGFHSVYQMHASLHWLEKQLRKHHSSTGPFVLSRDISSGLGLS
jgi:hypothetical protein